MQLRKNWKQGRKSYPWRNRIVVMQLRKNWKWLTMCRAKVYALTLDAIQKELKGGEVECPRVCWVRGVWIQLRKNWKSCPGIHMLWASSGCNYERIESAFEWYQPSRPISHWCNSERIERLSTLSHQRHESLEYPDATKKELKVRCSVQLTSSYSSSDATKKELKEYRGRNGYPLHCYRDATQKKLKENPNQAPRLVFVQDRCNSERIESSSFISSS